MNENIVYSSNPINIKSNSNLFNNTCSFSTHKHYFIFENNDEIFKLPISEIIYFESTLKSHRINIITKNETLEVYGSLKSIELLEKKFIRVHRSFVVNIDNVLKFDKISSTVYMNSQKKCFVAKSKTNTFKKLLKE